jgi:hypothetical protein
MMEIMLLRVGLVEVGQVLEIVIGVLEHPFNAVLAMVPVQPATMEICHM